MVHSVQELLQQRLTPEDSAKLARLANPAVQAFLAEAIALCQPREVFLCSDAPADLERVRQLALARGEEAALAIPGHTVHYDGYFDQGRDKGSTKFLLPAGVQLGRNLLSVEREEGLAEVTSLLRGSMAAGVMIVRFLCLGPVDSRFAIPCVQITDSAYVAHSETLLYRCGYEELVRQGPGAAFFRFLHSAGELRDGVSAHPELRRVYIDIQDDTVYSVNTQYAGNTVGLKKLAHRLAMRKAAREGWLAEHMLVMGVHGPGGRVTYFNGAFPSACGKTSTAMLPGQTIVGDDLAYLRKVDGEVRTCNVESGIFGIIQDVNRQNDPVIWDVLTRPGEVIFSNVLVTDGTPYWLGDGRQAPDAGRNHAGAWRRGQRDAAGDEIPLAHKNARYTLRIAELANRDPSADAPAGVELGAVVYGGRDSDTCPPVEQAFDWAHGVLLKGATIESETTAATLGKEGVRTFNLMSNLDFLSMPVGDYLQAHLDFAAGLARPPLVFGVNYFLKGKDGKYLNGLLDKTVWLQWAELRVHGDVPARVTPCGYIPRHEDLAPLFVQSLGREYTRAEYTEQFAVRTVARLAKLDRIEAIYRAEPGGLPELLFTSLAAERARLLAAQGQHGELIVPDILPLVD